MWSICQKYSVECVSTVSWEVKCTVMGIKQKGSESQSWLQLEGILHGRLSEDQNKKKKCQKTKINALFTLPETLCSTDLAGMIFFFFHVSTQQQL